MGPITTCIQKMNSLRQEADAAVARAEDAEKKIKELEAALLTKEQEVQSLTHRLGLFEEDNAKLEEQLREAKATATNNAQLDKTHDALTRKVQLLEDELDTSEKRLRESTEKLRQVDVKAEHFERQVQNAEKERAVWEKKYEVCLTLCSQHKRSTCPLGHGRKVQPDTEGLAGTGSEHGRPLRIALGFYHVAFRNAVHLEFFRLLLLQGVFLDLR
ncbi:hypothetical protein CVT24_006297 [Panaeolus cyanescens]|uniref:Uncharacterized protein n=1 Tax=Panaeolus cyanescens TaxID=181874 RepID=A0A409VAN3_9AGAR|nr:hypothetical protein CVT24_006297 [Panaeolus cyanescens]